MAKYELDITVLPEDVDKRQTLAARIDIALALSGCRITAGEYAVTIERKTAAQIRREAKEAEAEDAEVTAKPPQASSDEPNACPGCGRWSCTRPQCDGTESASP
jgi:hypothetical protein